MIEDKVVPVLDDEPVPVLGTMKSDGKSFEESFEIRFSKQQVAAALAEFIVNHQMIPNRPHQPDWTFFTDGSWSVILTPKVET